MKISEAKQNGCITGRTIAWAKLVCVNAELCADTTMQSVGSLGRATWDM
jgi:hypothetical protein